MPNRETPQAAPQLRPAWRGILGWLLFLAAAIVAATVPYPHNGQAILAVALATAGLGLVQWQLVSRAER